MNERFSYYANKEQQEANSSFSEKTVEKWTNLCKQELYHDHQIQRLAKRNSIELEQDLDSLIERFLCKHRAVLRKDQKQQLIQNIIFEVLGFGPIEPLLGDSGITEILINGPKEIYLERMGKLEKIELQFRDEAHLRHVIERMISQIGRRVDVRTPMVDARLPDGSRIHVVVPPVARNGPVVSIRKFPQIPYNLEKLVEIGMITPEMKGFFERMVLRKQNIIISGGTGTGKTTLLNGLAGAIPSSERIVTVEDMAELRIPHPHVVSLEGRPPNVESEGEITIHQLVRNALRMRPDRIIVGEVRGREALDMIQAMNTGHEGSITTIHANTPLDAIYRLESMIYLAGFDCPVSILRQYIVRALHFIIQLKRNEKGERYISEVSRVQLDGNAPAIQQYMYVDEDGICHLSRNIRQMMNQWMI